MGYIDGVGCLEIFVKIINVWDMKFIVLYKIYESWECQIVLYIVFKGSIVVNGISLIVVDCDWDGNWFQVVVIFYSFNEINLSYLKLGSLVNIEVDILGKYVVKFFCYGFNNYLVLLFVLIVIFFVNNLKDIIFDFLVENGFI